MRLQVVDDNIIRVSADPQGDFQRSASLMRADSGKPVPAFQVAEQDGEVQLKAAQVTAHVSTADGHVRFTDAAGKELLSEVAGGRSFTPIKVDGASGLLSTRQRFASPDDEKTMASASTSRAG